MDSNNQHWQDCYPHLIYLVNDFILWHLPRVRERFGGDLDTAMILGEIAHFNIQRFFLHYSQPSSIFTQALINAKSSPFYAESADLGCLIKKCNALSISDATGIPRETVRRKIKWLEQQGWIVKDEKGYLSVSTTTSEAFKEFNIEMLHKFLATAEQINKLLQKNSELSDVAQQ